MSEAVASPAVKAGQDAGSQVINDFQIVVATKNGTGSQTSNAAIIRALFAMGIPVNGKNIFPSNIKGLPTWFNIRVSKDGYIARKEVSEILVAMNETILSDVAKLPSGGYCVYDSGLGITPSREDVTLYELPVDEIIKEGGIGADLKERVRNMVYVGAVAFLIGIDLDEIDKVLLKTLKGKRKAVDLNMDVIKRGFAYGAEHWTDRPCRYKIERMDKTEGMILMEGNEAGALGAVFGGLTVLAWYPITPSSGMPDAATEYLAALRHDEDGKANYVVMQAEDELSAAGMIVGAGWAGARSMTATSGPGISLMAEFAGLAYYAEIPCVIWDIQRVGPATGLPTRTSQADILKAYLLSHGDTKHIVLLPGSLEEAFEDGWQSFDVAERMQTLVFVLSDLDLGMNLWMSKPFVYPNKPMDRGKVLNEEELQKHIEQFKAWGRYRDVDGDGIGYRTIPGNKHPQSAYFARGTGHNEMAVYSEEPEVWVRNMERLHHKFQTAKQYIPKPIYYGDGKADVGILAYGTTEGAILEARDRLAKQGIQTDYLRVRSLPLHDEIEDWIKAHKRVYVVENNHDGQLASIIRMEMPVVAAHIKSAAYMDGLPFSAGRVIELLKQAGEAI